MRKTLFVLIFVLTLLAGSVLAYNINFSDTNMIIYKFNETVNRSLINYAENTYGQYNLSHGPNITFGIEGLLDTTYYFNGTSSYFLTSDEGISLRMGEEDRRFSISVWFSLNESSRLQRLIGYGPENANLALATNLIVAEELNWYMETGVSSYTVGIDINKLDNKTWYNTIFVYNYSYGTMYLNGMRVDTTLINSDPLPYTQWVIGGGGPDRELMGMVDEIQIWNKSLSDSEIFYILYDSSFTELEIHSDVIYENRTANYFLNVSKPATSITAKFFFNGTEYDVNAYNDSAMWVFETNVNVPFFHEFHEPFNITSYWNYTVETFLENTTYLVYFNQTVSLNVSLDNCTDFSTKFLNISFWNEENTDNSLAASLDAEFFVYTLNKYYLGNFSIHENTTYEVGVCLYPNRTVLVDANIFTEVSGGFKQRWFLINATLTNNTESTLYIYNRDNTVGISDFKGVVRYASSYAYWPNIYAFLQRYYPAEGVWRTIQEDRSDEFGQIFFNIKEEEVDYKIVFQNYTTLIDTTESMKFICNPTTQVCELTFQLSPTGGVSGGVLNEVWSFDNTTGIGTLTWNDATGLTMSVRLLVEKTTYGDSVTICDTTVESSSGSINCDVSDYSGNFQVRVFSRQSPFSAVLLTWFAYNLDTALLNALGADEGVFWSLGLGLTITLMGLISIHVVIITFIIGLVVISMFKLTSFVTMGFLTSAAVLGIVIAILIRRKQGGGG